MRKREEIRSFTPIKGRSQNEVKASTRHDPVSVAAAKFTGQLADDFLKRDGKFTAVLIPHTIGNFHNTVIRMQKQLFCFDHTVLLDILRNSAAVNAFEAFLQSRL